MHHPIRARAARAVTAAVVILIAAACDTGPSSSQDPSVGRQATQHGFALAVSLPSASWSSTEDLPISTTLTWTGAAPAQAVWGSGSGIVSFAFREIGGAGRTMSGASTDDCRSTTYPRGEPVAIAARKSGGFSGEDPNAPFYREWFAEPGLRLPAGRWQVVVSAYGYLAPCSADVPILNLSLDPIELLIR